MSKTPEEKKRKERFDHSIADGELRFKGFLFDRHGAGELILSRTLTDAVPVQLSAKKK